MDLILDTRDTGLQERGMLMEPYLTQSGDWSQKDSQKSLDHIGFGNYLAWFIGSGQGKEFPGRGDSAHDPALQ